MPVLKALNPRTVEHMTRAAAILEEESQGMERLARELAGQAAQTPGGVSIACLSLTEAPPALAKRAVLALLERAAGRRQDLTAAHVSAVLELAREGRCGGQVSLPYGLTAPAGQIQPVSGARPGAACGGAAVLGGDGPVWTLAHFS